MSGPRPITSTRWRPAEVLRTNHSKPRPRRTRPRERAAAQVEALAGKLRIDGGNRDPPAGSAERRGKCKAERSRHDGERVPERHEPDRGRDRGRRDDSRSRPAAWPRRGRRRRARSPRPRRLRRAVSRGLDRRQPEIEALVASLRSSRMQGAEGRPRKGVLEPDNEQVAAAHVRPVSHGLARRQSRSTWLPYRASRVTWHPTGAPATRTSSPSSRTIASSTAALPELETPASEGHE